MSFRWRDEVAYRAFFLSMMIFWVASPEHSREMLFRSFTGHPKAGSSDIARRWRTSRTG